MRLHASDSEVVFEGGTKIAKMAHAPHVPSSYAAAGRCDHPFHSRSSTDQGQSLWPALDFNEVSPVPCQMEHAAIGLIDIRPKAVAHLSDECQSFSVQKSFCIMSSGRASDTGLAQNLPASATWCHFSLAGLTSRPLFHTFFCQKGEKGRPEQWTPLMVTSRITRSAVFRAC